MLVALASPRHIRMAVVPLDRCFVCRSFAAMCRTAHAESAQLDVAWRILELDRRGSDREWNATRVALGASLCGDETNGKPACRRILSSRL